MVEQVKDALINQHLTSLKMLENCIASYTDNLWINDRFVNSSWRLAYHSLYYFRLYLHQDLSDHQPWAQHREGAETLALHSDFVAMSPYSRDELISCCQDLSTLVKPMVNALDISAKECGFPWYQISKVEHLIVNVKHLQQHVGQLQDRLRNHEGVGIAWTKEV